LWERTDADNMENDKRIYKKRPLPESGVLFQERCGKGILFQKFYHRAAGLLPYLPLFCRTGKKECGAVPASFVLLYPFHALAGEMRH
jgi:hypothetical protein